jgi:hypothetical protein
MPGLDSPEEGVLGRREEWTGTTLKPARRADNLSPFSTLEAQVKGWNQYLYFFLLYSYAYIYRTKARISKKRL